MRGWGRTCHGRTCDLPATTTGSPTPLPSMAPSPGQSNARRGARCPSILQGLGARRGPSLGRPAEEGGSETVRTPCAAFSRSHMEPGPYGAGATGSTASAGGWEPPPAARRGGGHALPTCLGRHRGAQERLETGGAELADRPHAAGVPRRMPPAPGRSQAGAERPERCVWPSSGLPSTRRVAST